MTEETAAYIRQRQMDEEDERERAAAKRWLHCFHKEACDQANSTLDGTMETFDALPCDSCKIWERV